MQNKTPIVVLTGLGIVAAAAVAGLTRDQWMGHKPEVVASATQPAPATTEPPKTPDQPAPAAQQPAAACRCLGSTQSHLHELIYDGQRERQSLPRASARAAYEVAALGQRAESCALNWEQLRDAAGKQRLGGCRRQRKI